jgi:hypothetical protein
MENDGLPMSIAIIIAAVILGALTFMGWVVATVLSHSF